MYQSGFTLIEVMVAMMITLILMSAVFMTFTKSSEAYRYTMGLADIQERGRFAMSFLQEAIRTADYTGCQQGVPINNQLNNPAGYFWNFGVGIEGVDSSEDDDLNVPPTNWNNAWAPAIDPALTLPQGTGDVITVRGSVGTSVRLTGGMATLASPLPLAAANDTFAQNSIMMVSSCAGLTDVFQRTNAQGTGVVAHAAGAGNPGNAVNTLAAPGYPTDSHLTQVMTRSFFIRTNPAGTGNSLYVRWGPTNAELRELIEDVDGMQIQYGITTDNTRAANQYLTADQVAAAGAWASVVSVRISLLVRSPDGITKAQDNRIYRLFGIQYGPYRDLRRRRVFTTVVSLRNRMN